MIDCSDKHLLPQIEILYGGYWFQVDADDYAIQIDNTCFLCMFSAGNFPAMIFGDAFLKGYYSTHDHDTKQFGFVPSTISTKPAIFAGTPPTDVLEENVPYQRNGSIIFADFYENGLAL